MTIHLKRKGLSICRLAEDVLYAKAQGQTCLLHFKNGEVLQYSYRLNIFEQRVVGASFVRVHRSYLLKLTEAIGYAWRQAKLTSGELLPLNDEGYNLVKEYIDKIRPASAVI